MLKKMSGYLTQQLFLLQRDLLFQVRNPRIQVARTVGTVFLGVFVALVFLNVYGYNNGAAAVFQVSRS